MSDRIETSQTADSPQLLGSVMGSILGGIVGMVVCILALLLGWLCWIESAFLLQLFVGPVIGWFYRLFHGRRSKPAAYAVVAVCTVLACVLGMTAFALLSAGISPAQLTAEDWGQLWGIAWELLLLCAGLGLAGFFFARGKLLTYVDWEKAPWHIARSYAGGLLYNWLPEKLPDKIPPKSFAVCSRGLLKTCIIAEESHLRWKRPFQKDCIFSAGDIAGVVLGPSSGCNVIYGKNYRLLAKFAASMEHADLLFLWLLQRNISMDKAPIGWRLPEKSEAAKVKNPVSQQQFTLRLKPSARRTFIGIGCILLLFGLLFLLAVDFSPMTQAGRWVAGGLDLVAMGLGINSLRIGRLYKVEITGEQICAASRFGPAIKFSVREAASASRHIGWIVLYDKEWKPLVKLDPELENLKMLEEYLALYGIRL